MLIESEDKIQLQIIFGVEVALSLFQIIGYFITSSSSVFYFIRQGILGLLTFLAEFFILAPTFAAYRSLHLESHWTIEIFWIFKFSFLIFWVLAGFISLFHLNFVCLMICTQHTVLVGLILFHTLHKLKTTVENRFNRRRNDLL